MPCDQIRQSTINLGKVGDRSLLVKALDALGYRAQEIQGGLLNFGDGYNGGTIHPDGRVELRGKATDMDENTIKRAYSTEAVKMAAARFGWSAKQTTDTTFVAQRRY